MSEKMAYGEAMEYLREFSDGADVAQFALDTLEAERDALQQRVEALERLLQSELCDCVRHADDVPLNPHSPTTHDFSCPYRRKWNDALAAAQDKAPSPWWQRMSNEDIAAELSATFDLGLDVTRRVANWILTEPQHAAAQGAEGET